MTTTWTGPPTPKSKPMTARGLLRVVLRVVPLLAILVVGLVLMLLLRLIERPLYHPRRPITPMITTTVCRTALRILRLTPVRSGHLSEAAIASVANHSSWLDIFVLNAGRPLYFVSKAEVEGWPGIGWLAKATGTVFIKRSRVDAANQVAQMQDRMRAGHHLLFFPEGTSTDGQQVLPFKSTLFATFIVDGLRTGSIQPISLRYVAPPGEDAVFYGWWGDMGFGPSLLQILAAPPGGSVHVTYSPAVAIASVADRKQLARTLETAVRDGFAASLAHSGDKVA